MDELKNITDELGKKYEQVVVSVMESEECPRGHLISKAGMKFRMEVVYGLIEDVLKDQGIEEPSKMMFLVGFQKMIEDFMEELTHND